MPAVCGSCSTAGAAPSTPATVLPSTGSSPQEFLETLRNWVSGQHTASRPDAPSLRAPSWLRASRVEGLAHSSCKAPDIARVQAQRPETGGDPDQLKAARRQLSLEHSKQDLLRQAPAPGHTARYAQVRHAILERWAVYAYIVSAVAEASRDEHLLAALIDCAMNRGNEAPADCHEERYRWRTLEKATSLDEFVDLLDQLYADSADNLVEDEWAQAQADPNLAPVDLYYRLKPLLVDSATIKRGKAILLERLASSPDNRTAMSQLRACRDTAEGLHEWRKVFACMQADAALLKKSSNRRGAGSGGGAPSRGLNAFGDFVDGTAPQDNHFHADMHVDLQMSQLESAKTLLAIVQDRARQQGLPPPLRLDDPAVPVLMQSAAAVAKPAELTTLAQAIDALTTLVRTQGASGQQGERSASKLQQIW